MKATVCRQNQTSGNSHNEESINIHFHISIFHGGRIIHSNNLEIHTGETERAFLVVKFVTA